jgi:hypothetical protein
MSLTKTKTCLEVPAMAGQILTRPIKSRPSRRRNLTDQKFGILTVIERVEGEGKSRWKCLCECGNTTIVFQSNLVKKKRGTKSCGCLRVKIPRMMQTRHGKSNTRTHRIWTGMLSRCNNVNYANYKNYGARGIKVCKSWHTFENFLNDMGEAPEGMSIERIDNNGDYVLANCKWATRIEQANNKRGLHYLTIDGKTQTLASWESETGIPAETISKRLKRGWTEKEALEIELKVHSVGRPARKYT